MSDEEGPLTEDDITDLNRMSVERGAAFVRMAGSAVVGIGIVGVLAWLWTAVRIQQEATPAEALNFSVSSQHGVSWIDRIDLLSPYVSSLVVAAAVTAFGFLLRLLADFLVDRVGGTTTGFEAGDTLDDDGAELLPDV
jgi:hypothetical protein